ncbi:MAG TPA: alpha/beta fold hydrolase [Streptosporangiaceae bacterium]|nr:alpha/beta fold hydrolase [Streptosporangiaceae bacterium]
MNRTARRLTATAAGAMAVGLAALAATPAARQAALRAARFARPLDRDAAGPPVPPRLPPGRVVSLPGRGEVFVRESDGPPAAPAVLLLHGWTASADLNFFPVYESLAGTYRVIAPDARGHGRGMRSAEPFRLEDCADDAAALLELLGADRVIAVGYSMGGPVGMLLARRHPGRVKALVMQATALQWRDAAYERMAWRLLSVMELGLRVGTASGIVERLLRLTTEGQPEIEALRPWLAAEFRRGLAPEIADAGRALSGYDARPWAARLGLPAAMLITTRDRLVRPAKQRELAAALNAHVTEIDADHDLPLTRSADYARLTRLAVDTVAATAFANDLSSTQATAPPDHRTA